MNETGQFKKYFVLKPVALLASLLFFTLDGDMGKTNFITVFNISKTTVRGDRKLQLTLTGDNREWWGHPVGCSSFMFLVRQPVSGLKTLQPVLVKCNTAHLCRHAPQFLTSGLKRLPLSFRN